jgi:hypothetical protein
MAVSSAHISARRATGGSVGDLSTSRAPQLLFAVAFAVGIIETIFPVGYSFGPGYEMAAAARNLAATGVFGNPFEPIITGPTAAVPPLYPFLMSLVLRALHALFAYRVISFSNVICNAISAALMPRLSLLLFGSRRPGVFAGLLAIVSLRIMPEWDAGFTLCALLVYFTVTLTVAQKGGFSLLTAAVSGLGAGLITYANPATLLVSVPWILFLAVASRWSGRVAIGRGLVFTLLFAGAITPWIVRNYQIWHALVVRTNFGMTVYASNNDCAKASMAEDNGSGCFGRYHPSQSVDEAALLSRLGEVEYDRQRTKATIKWVDSHRLQFARLTLARFGWFWFPKAVSPEYASFGTALATLLSVPGIVLMFKRRIPFAWAVLFAYGVFPLMYYIVVTDERYRYPIIWCSFLSGGYFLAYLTARLRSQNS